MKKINIAVIMGGKTPEHEISLISGKEVVKNLNGDKYNVLPIIISKDGKRWQLVSPKNLLESSDPLKLKGTRKELTVVNSREISGTSEVVKKGVQIAFIAMHGPYGEDGTVQGMLELAGIPFTGPGVLASALGMDKEMFRKIMCYEKLPIPKYMVVKRGERLNLIEEKLGKPPYFVKPAKQGSSVGASIARTHKDLRKSLSRAFRYDDTALIDEYIKGLEVTCAVLGNRKPLALPVIEIRPKGKFFDYDSKYMPGGSEEIVPARISKNLARKVQELAIKVYKAIGCRGFSRVDFILENNKSPIILEINTIPGLTPMSLLPKAAKAAGISYTKLLEKIINYALSK